MYERYEINSFTIAIIPLDSESSKVIETHHEFVVKKPVLEIMDDSCRYFGSSYEGRHEGTKSLIGMNYKAPIIIEESLELIFFPTASPRIQECIWISLNYVDRYYRAGDKTILHFKNGKSIDLDISYGALENQILRATRLESVLHKRKLQ